MGKRLWDEPEKSGEGKQRVATSKGLSGWTKVGIIAGGGMGLFLFGAAMYLNWTGILPAANRLSSVQAAYKASGAPKSIAEIQELYVVPDDQNAALILTYLADQSGLRTSIEFPLGGKTGTGRPTVSWKKFVSDIDQAANRLHFRPKRDFSNPYAILLPEFALMKWGGAECFRQAAAAVERNDFQEAERYVRRATLLDRWVTDQPFLIGKIVRPFGVPEFGRFIDKLLDQPPRPEITRLLEMLKEITDRKMDIQPVAAIEAYSMSQIGGMMDDPAEWGVPFSTSPTSSSGSAMAAFEQKAFGFAMRSPMGKPALLSLGTEMGTAFYEEWKKSGDLDKAFDSPHKVLAMSGESQLVATMSRFLPMMTGSGVNENLSIRPKIWSQMLEIALWIDRRRSQTQFDLTRLKASDLPAPLQVDGKGNPIMIVPDGSKVRVYSFGADGNDDLGGAKDVGFTVGAVSR